MSALPTGWTISNKAGSSAGPARRSSVGSDDSDESQHGINIQPDSPGWEDAEPDEEDDLSIKCLLCNETFGQAKRMLDHCEAEHGFDLLAICKQHSLDFYGTIKLVNYVRTQARSGISSIDTTNPQLWQDDNFMQPALEDDALLFSLDELIEDPDTNNNGAIPDYDERQAVALAKEQKTDLENVPE